MEETITLPAVPTTAIKTVLKMYRDMGMSELFISTERSEKLSSVGWVTKKRGGKIHSSLRGFRALLMVYTSGSTIKEAHSSRKARFTI